MSIVFGIAFDLEGTLVNVEPDHHRGHIEAARELGLELTFSQALRMLPHFIGGPDAKIAEEIWVAAGRPTQSSPEAVLVATKRHFRRLLDKRRIKLRAGAGEFIDRVRAGDAFKVAIGSLTERESAQLLLERSGLSRMIRQSCIVLAEDVSKLKPDPEVYLTTAARMGIDPKRQLVFEDSPNGIRAALAAGSRAVGIPVYRRRDVIQKLRQAGAGAVRLSWRDAYKDVYSNP